MATNHGEVLEYAWDHPQVRPIDRELPYFVALPTTAGTGSEVGRSSVVSDDVTHVKKIIFSPKLLARCVFADPELTLDLPPAITAATGMDALTHNVESYLSPAYHPLCDGIALEGVRIAARALPIAYRDGKNLAARSDMLMSSMMGADRVPEGSRRRALVRARAVHGGRPAPWARQRDHDRPRDALQLAGRDDEDGRARARRRCCAAPAAWRSEAAASAFVAWLAQMKADLGIPATLSATGRRTRPVTRADMPALVDVAIDDICHQTNPASMHARGFRADLRGGDLIAASTRHAEDRHLRLLLPRGPQARDLQGHDAAVHRAERRALADAARRARLHGAVARGPHADAPGSRATVDAYAQELDGLVLMGGSDVCPESTARRRSSPSGTATASATTTRSRCCGRSWRCASPCSASAAARRSSTSRKAARCTRTSPRRLPHALNHRNWAIYEQNCHATSIVPGSGLARLYPGHAAGQDQFDPPPGGEGARPRSRRRGVVGAGPHRRGDPLHGTGLRVRASNGIPSSTRPDDPSFLDDTPILDEFLAAAAQHKSAAYTI